MKEYIKPEIEIVEFSITEEIATALPEVGGGGDGSSVEGWD